MEETMNRSKRLWLDDFLDYLPNYDNDSYYEIDEEGQVCGLSTNFEPVFIPVLYSVMFVVGILGNGLLLGVLFKSRKIWRVTDTFILHRALADILLVMMLPVWAAQSASVAGWVFGTFFCKITGSVFTINFYSGIFHLVCISVNNYLSINHSTNIFRLKKPWVVHACCVSVLIFSMLLSIPDWIFLEDLEDHRAEKTVCCCNYQKFDLDVRTYKTVARGLFHTLGFVLPSVVLFFGYSCIQWKLWSGSKSHRKQSAYKTITAVLVVFFLWWAPYNITFIVDTFKATTSETACASKQSLVKALIVTSALGCIHCCLNPILCFLVDVKYQHQLKMWTKSSSSSIF